MKISKTHIIIVLFFLFGIPLGATSSEKDSSGIRLVENLIDNNLRYSRDVTPQDIIRWEDDIVAVYRENKDFRRMFLTKHLAVYAHSYQAQIPQALKKANDLMSEARAMKDDTGIAISYFTFGDIYLYAGMETEAVEEYEKALNILLPIPETEKLQERIFIQLVPTLVKLRRMNEAKNYLTKMERIYARKELNPFYLYIYQAYYSIRINDLSNAEKFISEAEKHIQDKPFYFHASLLKYVKAEYARKTGYYDNAILLYKDLADDSCTFDTYHNYLKLRKNSAELYKKRGQYKEACEAYHDIKTARDSINAHSYSSQINLLRTVYQVDRLAIHNQEQQHRLLFYLIVGSILILTFSVVFVIHLKLENNRLAASRKKLDKARKNAENSIRTKSLFLSNMSHEIRTPLNALSGFSSILTETNIDADIRRQCNDIIQQNSDLLLKLIDDVVDLSSLERGKMQFRFSTYDAVALCKNVVDTVDKIKQTSAAVIFQTELEKLNLYTDEARLQQLLINLLINATKFTTEGCITLSLEVQEDKALFAVTDTGCGIAPEKQVQIFNRFEKLNENAQGSGLGLSICQLIIEHFGGKIWIDSEYTTGCRFVFTHPIMTDARKEETKI